MDYKLIAEIPILNVPDNITIQEAKVTAEIWLKTKIPDAEFIAFLEAKQIVVLFTPSQEHDDPGRIGEFAVGAVERIMKAVTPQDEELGRGNDSTYLQM